MISPTLGFESGYVNKVPVIIDQVDKIVPLVNCNISNCRDDWDAFETSWDFKKHPLV